jgi:hypothetical protein
MNPTRASRALALGAAVLAAGPIQAARAGEFHVTVYNNGLALVKETREVDLPRGVGEISFTGVAEQIDPTSVRLVSSGDDLSVLEQNYRYDLVSRAKLLERYLDRTARIVTKHDKLHEGILKSAAGSLILETDDGVVLLTEDEIADVTLPEIPEGLITRPTLVWKVENDGPARRPIEIAYLTEGVAWHAEYVAAVDSKDERLNLSGWVSIENACGATFPDARLKVVAGDVHRAVRPGFGGRQADAMGMEMMAKAPGFEERSFFEYHIYDLGRSTTIADKEVKQIQLLEGREFPVRKEYVYEPTRDEKVQVRLEFENTKANGLGIPLPGGKFRVYREDADGALEFAGEDFLDHTARDEEVSVFLGHAFDLVGERNDLESRRVADRIQETRTEIKVRNRKESGRVSLIVREHPGGDWKVLESTHEWKKPNALDLEFEIEVPAGEEVVIGYRVRSEF